MTEVTEKVTVLVREEIELAKVEVTEKLISIGKGIAAVAVAAVFAVFGLVFVLETLAWVLNAIIAGSGDLWWGFLIVTLVLFGSAVGGVLFALRKLKVGVPTPRMAIAEAKKISATLKSKPKASA